MQHIWKVLLTSLLIFALAATACLAEDSEAQYQAYSYTTFSLRRTPSESDRGISVRKKTKILIWNGTTRGARCRSAIRSGMPNRNGCTACSRWMRCIIPCKICRIA